MDRPQMRTLHPIHSLKDQRECWDTEPHVLYGIALFPTAIPSSAWDGSTPTFLLKIAIIPLTRVTRLRPTHPSRAGM